MNYAARKKRFIEVSERFVEKLEQLRSAEADLFAIESQQINKDDAKFTPDKLERKRLATIERVSLYNDELNDLRVQRKKALDALKPNRKEVSGGIGL